MLDQIGNVLERLQGHDVELRDLHRRVEAVMVGNLLRADAIDGIIPAANAPVNWFYNGNLMGAGTRADFIQHARVWISGVFLAGRAYYNVGTYPDPPYISGVDWNVDDVLVGWGRSVDFHAGAWVWISGTFAGGEAIIEIGGYYQGGGGGASGTVAFYDDDDLFCECLQLNLVAGAGVYISGTCTEGGGRANYEIGLTGGGGGAPADAQYVVAAADPNLTNEIVKEYMGDNVDPCVYPAAPNALDDEFEDGGAIDGKWTKINDPAGADALNQTAFPGHLHVGLAELGTDTFDNLVRLYQTPPTGAQTMEFVARVALAITGQLGGEGGEFCGVTVYLGNSVNDEGVGADIEVNFTASAYQAYIVMQAVGQQISAGSIVGMTTGEGQRAVTPGGFVFIKLAKTTANAYTSANTYKAYLSGDGLIWHEVGTTSFTFTTACNEVGVYFRRPKSQSGTPKGEALVDFFRRTV